MPKGKLIEIGVFARVEQAACMQRRNSEAEHSDLVLVGREDSENESECGSAGILSSWIEIQFHRRDS